MGENFSTKPLQGLELLLHFPFLQKKQGIYRMGIQKHFPRLADAMSLLDATFSARFPNAVAPLISAHAEAAIPLNLGKEVLEQLASRLMSEEEA